MGLQRRPATVFISPQKVRVLVRVADFPQGKPGWVSTHSQGFSSIRPHARKVWELGKALGRRNEAVVDGRTSSQPRGLGGKDKRDQTPIRIRGPRPTPALRLHRPAPAIAAPRSCEGPTLRPRGRNGGVPSPAPPRGGPALYGKAVPS